VRPGCSVERPRRTHSVNAPHRVFLVLGGGFVSSPRECVSRPGEVRRGGAALQRARMVREQGLGPSHPDVAATRSDLSAVLSEQGRSEKEEAKAEGVTPATAQALHSRGLAAWREGKYSEAEGLYKRALARVLVCEATEPTKRRALRRAIRP
jgi:hypothetical protein